jgi:hypothetical protein
MSFIGKAIGSITGSDKAAQAATTGAQISADAQREALAYLKETEALPQELREGALSTIGGLYGFGDVKPADALGAITNSEMYKQVLGSRAAGEEAILRNAAATGGLRSGNVQDALAGYNIELQQQAFNQGLSGLQGLAQLPSNANQIAGTTAGIGQTLGQGQVAAGQAVAAGRGGFTSALIGGLGAYTGAGGTFSDSRLKTNIKPAGKRNGLPWYTWDWNKEAEALGLFGSDEGVMAHEIADLKPEAIRVTNGYLTVNYDALGVN